MSRYNLKESALLIVGAAFVQTQPRESAAAVVCDERRQQVVVTHLHMERAVARSGVAEPGVAAVRVDAVAALRRRCARKAELIRHLVCDLDGIRARIAGRARVAQPVPFFDEIDPQRRRIGESVRRADANQILLIRLHRQERIAGGIGAAVIETGHEIAPAAFKQGEFKIGSAGQVRGEQPRGGSLK